MALTNLELEKSKAKDKKYHLSDGDGLSIDIMPSGGKLWRFRFRHNGKPNMMSLGKYPAVSIKDARRKRDEARVLLEQGKDPAAEKRAEKLRNKHKGENTFEAISRKWMDLKENRLNEKYHKQCVARLEQHVFPLIGSKPITDIDIPNIVDIVEKIAARGTVEQARRIKQLISQTFRYASQRGMCTHNPAADLRDVLPTKEIKHHGCVPMEEAPQLLRDMKEYQGSLVVKLALGLLALTFVRTNEIIGAKWDEINWETREWHIPKERMKMKKPHMVPLSNQAILILQELQQITGAHEHIFHSAASKSKHISNNTFLSALKRMGYEKRMTGHGFRTLASTILNELLCPPDVIERQLAHADRDKVRSAYNRAEYILERKKMMQDFADHLDFMKAGGAQVIHNDFSIGKQDAQTS